MSDGTAFAPHEIEWTRQKAIRVWDFLSQSPAHASSYFSLQVGNEVIDYARRFVELGRGLTLDFGCGPGYLVEKLARRGLPVEAVDFSSRSIEALRQRLAHERSFRGAHVADGLPTPIASAKYQAIFFLEIIEHLIGDELPATLTELSRLAAPGGHVIITTNNEENLDADKHMCPECGCIFHRVQHTLSWSPEGLAHVMDQHGFDPVHCEALNFRPATLANRVLELGSRVLRRKPLNLIYIGRRR